MNNIYRLHLHFDPSDDSRTRLGRFLPFQPGPPGVWSVPPSRAWAFKPMTTIRNVTIYPDYFSEHGNGVQFLPGQTNWIADNDPAGDGHTGCPRAIKPGDSIEIAIRVADPAKIADLKLFAVFCRATDGQNSQGASPFLTDSGYRKSLFSMDHPGPAENNWFRFPLGRVGRLPAIGADSGADKRHFEFSVVVQYRSIDSGKIVQLSHDPEVICDMSGS